MSPEKSSKLSSLDLDTFPADEGVGLAALGAPTRLNPVP